MAKQPLLLNTIMQHCIKSIILIKHNPLITYSLHNYGIKKGKVHYIVLLLYYTVLTQKKRSNVLYHHQKLLIIFLFKEKAHVKNG